MKKHGIACNWVYVLWFLFYFFLTYLIFSIFTKDALAIVTVLYAICLLIAFTPVAEGIMRFFMGVRELQTSREMQMLFDSFGEVYDNALAHDETLFKNIKLYICDDLEVNAFAFGRHTLCLNKGAIEYMTKRQLMGIIAHEFGHFSHIDTVFLLISTVSNSIMNLILKILELFARGLNHFVERKEGGKGLIKLIWGIFMLVVTFIEFIGAALVMPASRKDEYVADKFAHDCGYGDELISALYLLDELEGDRKRTIRDMIKATHPPLKSRIQTLERYN